MLPILVPSSDTCIVTQILVIAKLNERKDFIFRGFVCDIISLYKELSASKASYWSTRIRCENCSKLRMKTLERCQWRHSSVYIVNRRHISNFLLFIHFEQANVFWVNMKKIDTFEDKIRYILRYVVVIYV